MAVVVYNSLTRKKEEFRTLNEGRVGMYVCGPTVYDEPHIGHARSAYIFDVIRRYLKYRNYEVKFVRNVTDVDDKIIEKAKQEYPGEDLNSAVSKVSDKYLKSYHEAMNKLGIEPPDVEPKATEHIGKMQEFIKILIERSISYEANGDVYFDIKKAKGYGSLSHQSLDKMEAGARIAPGENKKDPLDFALWKKAKEGEPSWDSPWGAGRPGWHIECSVMSSDILGDEFDIHGGGLDLIFPHHENELAQSKGAGKNFARYWIHHGLLTINEQKMSKSLGNFVTIDDVLQRYPSDVLKICYLTVHYAKPLDFSWERLDVAREELERIRECIRKIDHHIKLRKDGFPRTRPIIEFIDFENKINTLKKKFEDAMDDDFNTPQAKSAIFQIISRVHIDILRAENIECLEYARKTIIELGKVLGLSFDSVEEIGSELVFKIEERSKAREAKDFKRADSIREELEEKGIILEDTKDGKTTWRRKL